MRLILIIAALAAVFVVSCLLLDLDFGKFTARLRNLPTLLHQLFAFEPAAIPEILAELLVSICIAVTALIFGAVVSFILAALAATNISPHPVVSVVVKSVVTIIRAVPILVWILMVVASIGFGNAGGVVGLIFPTVGYLTRSFTASFEEDGDHTIEALRATGARWIDIVLKGLTMQTLPKLVSWIALCFETNVAAGISLGMIGVGGVGFLLNKAIMAFDYPKISTIIVMIVAAMIVFEAGSLKIRKTLSTT